MSFYEFEYGVKSNFLSRILSKQQNGKVHSIFQSSLNIQFGKSLIHIGPLGTPLSSFGINIPKLKLKTILNKVTIGDTVESVDRKIFIRTFQAVFVVHIDKFTTIDLRIHPAPIDTRKLKRNAIYKMILGINYNTMSGMIQSQHEKNMLYKLLSCRNDSIVIKEVIRYFFGRGIGLTPSGDDFLSGIVMVESFFAQTTTWQSMLEKHIKVYETTDVSLNYYYSLLSGFVSENFLNLFRNLYIDVYTTKAKRIVKDVTNYGHTSGYDTLLGIIVAIKLNILEE
ncbi:oxamate carbamoyltransferase subunit AllH family protein [Bacillus andreraoultii]|uniref:oxamate carbamoyltransferase subunit AllH family protein n=1 Tax=Bacillus andreraoultii TaxID=1499685 RepID=UPI00053989BC|nr:DUF2877 domain-containing protein [Bacillus andreraoultii]